jgi:OOP family OmpA-OmpF porin
MMKVFPKLELDISAFTDDIGSFEDNIKLSVLRAETAKKFLVDLGIDQEKVKANGYGESNPIDTNATEIGRQKNRRVVFKLNKTE